METVAAITASGRGGVKVIPASFLLIELRFVNVQVISTADTVNDAAHQQCPPALPIRVECIDHCEEDCATCRC